MLIGTPFMDTSSKMNFLCILKDIKKLRTVHSRFSSIVGLCAFLYIGLISIIAVEEREVANVKSYLNSTFLFDCKY